MMKLWVLLCVGLLAFSAVVAQDEQNEELEEEATVEDVPEEINVLLEAAEPENKSPDVAPVPAKRQPAPVRPKRNYQSPGLKTEGKMMSSMMQRIRTLAHNSAGGRAPPHSHSGHGHFIRSGHPHNNRLGTRSSPLAIPEGSHLGPAAHAIIKPTADLSLSSNLEHPIYLRFVPLSHYDYRQLWLRMLYDTHKIMADETILENEEFSVKVLKKVFHLLQDLTLFEKVKKHDKCPYSYDQVEHLCLSTEPVNVADDGTIIPSTYTEARDFCKAKGGDLVVVRDSNEHRLIWKYLHEDADRARTYDYYMGVTDEGNPGTFLYNDGTPVQQGVPFFLRASTAVLDVLPIIFSSLKQYLILSAQ